MAAFIRSFAYALDGIAHVIRTQRNMRVHLAISAAVTLAGVWLNITTTEWAIIFVAAGVVFAAETLNTVVESLVDLVSPDHHPLAKIAKDAAAGAVLLAAIAALGVGLVTLLPRLIFQFGW